jgi:FkbM family methyltransferase
MSTIKEFPAATVTGAKISCAAESTLKLTAFDQRKYRKIIAARAETIRRVVGKLKPLFHFSSALDAGCGVGFFSKTLEDCGLQACGFDGREENIAEARRRYPGVPFETADIEQDSIRQAGKFDFVLCCGLLYHLENPLRAMRNLRALTDKCLLLESMCTPDTNASLLLRAEPNAEDQSLTDLAWYPSESALVKMLYGSGFATVYRVVPLPAHEEFRETRERTRRRTMLLASCAPIDVAGLRLCPEPHEARDPWTKREENARSLRRRAARFLTSPLRRKYITLALRARRIFRGMPIPLRLPFGAWWLAQGGALDHELMYNQFEQAELSFVQRMLKPGMTVVDIGAHHGLYTLLASKCVGRRGQVLAFEPSPREGRRLQKHLRLNRRRNVEVDARAVADNAGEAELHVVDNYRDWGNSLRPPSLPEAVHSVRVKTCRLDDALAEKGIRSVDFIKLDTEGAELAVLEGAQRLLRRAPRPVILAEVQDLRTRPWGYEAREIMQKLARWNYRWFSTGETGELYPASADEEEYDGNFVAVPEEKIGEFKTFIAQD